MPAVVFRGTAQEEVHAILGERREARLRQGGNLKVQNGENPLHVRSVNRELMTCDECITHTYDIRQVTLDARPVLNLCHPLVLQTIVRESRAGTIPADTSGEQVRRSRTEDRGENVARALRADQQAPGDEADRAERG